MVSSFLILKFHKLLGGQKKLSLAICNTKLVFQRAAFHTKGGELKYSNIKNKMQCYVDIDDG